MKVEKMKNCKEIVEAEPTPRYYFYSGYDKTPALPVDSVRALAQGTVKVVGFYIGGLNYSSSDRGPNNTAISFTKTRREEYLSIPSIRLAYIYVGRSDQGRGAYKILNGDKEAVSKGVTDAREAEKLAKDLGIPADSVIYLDVEGGDIHIEEVVDYVKSWVQTINNNTQYWAGIYCSYGSNGDTARPLYDGVDHKANMYIARWFESSGYCYNMFTGETYKTSYENPAKWYDLDPEERVPGVGCVVCQYSGDVYINTQGVKTIVDQISSIVHDPSVKQF